MIVVDDFRGRPVGVLGLAKSGRAAAQALAAGGAEILAWDDNPKAREALAAQLPIRDLATADWRNIAALVLSPGIPHSFPEPHPAVTRARDAGAAIIGDLELLGRAQPEARYIGITGTNGKSTTTALIGHILAAAGQRVEVGGNLGTPALSLAPLGRDGSYVIEASSFQLELITTLAFDIALLLNITPDHLDRHGTMEGYVAAKRHIFARQNKAATAIVGVDDAICRDLCDELRRTSPARVVPISVLQPVSGGVYVDQGWLVDAMGGQPVRVLDLGLAERLPGAHNWQNAAAAYAAARVSGVDTAAANADATEKALLCYPAIYWIAGGLAKAGGIEPLAPHFGRLRRTFLIGRATEEFAATLEGSVPFTRCGDLATAVAAASAQARHDGVPGAVVLLSPACASYDQFKNFEERGDIFRSLVEGLREALSR